MRINYNIQTAKQLMNKKSFLHELRINGKKSLMSTYPDD